ncbi:Gfo/Idh/MocA family protein [Streptomonospora wellingtoniae]|uniref:Gfo/Idh/MocA family oxidoreductase n=1 Tax=Streptomonospora wellingtoniae TaxID=3075544 RepID=A0ABU2KWP6_9ACTN|nr:Gfo/Idh/MocA family oxidoreductase [Streptomonospora sp. DSM 45055]MDT0303721.1 Gfo/Idh/MocA family oxidoreductase [Streptomonospora sp. DSM 45055]
MTNDLSSSTPVRWGILGTGGIAHRFMTGLRAVDDAEVVAVGSRSAATADRFARTWDIPRSHATYAELAADEGVDVVYVATPHNFHHEPTVTCLRAGRHVLCEKPLAVNAGQAAAMTGAAASADRFLMEAMWTRFAPATRKVRDLLAEGAIGEVRMVQAGIGGRMDYDPQGRLFSPDLAGGALLDVGVYPVAFASMVLGDLTSVQAQAHKAPTGVDSQVAMTVTGSGGTLGVLSCSIEAPIPRRADIVGTRGSIALTDWFCPSGLVLHREGADPERFDYPHTANGFEYEVMEVHRRLRAGERQSPLMSWRESVRIAEALDAARERIGVVYPGEHA